MVTGRGSAAATPGSIRIADQPARVTARPSEQPAAGRIRRYPDGTAGTIMGLME
jgi:hypothetical protein